MNTQDIAAISHVLSGCQAFCNVLGSAIDHNVQGEPLQLNRDEMATLRAGAAQMLQAMESLDLCYLVDGEEAREMMKPVLQVKPLAFEPLMNSLKQAGNPNAS